MDEEVTKEKPMPKKKNQSKKWSQVDDEWMEGEGYDPAAEELLIKLNSDLKKPALENLKNSAVYLGAKEGLWPEACKVIEDPHEENRVGNLERRLGEKG